MSRETKADKALRYLQERRLTVTTVGDPKRPGLIAATCRGDSGNILYLGFDPRGKGGRWGCTCEANAKFGRECSHLIALKMVTVAA